MKTGNCKLRSVCAKKEKQNFTNSADELPLKRYASNEIFFKQVFVYKLIIGVLSESSI